MTVVTPKRSVSRNNALLRVLQGLAAYLVVALRWESLKEALLDYEKLSSSDLFEQLLMLLLSLGLSISLTTISFIYLHGKLLNSPWEKNPDVPRAGLINEVFAILLALLVGWITWPNFAKSSYFGYQYFLEQLVVFGRTSFLIIALVMASWGGVYSIVLFRRALRKRADNG